MMMRQIEVPDRHARVRRDIAIWDLLVWAFQKEFASVDFDDVRSEAAAFVAGYGMEYVILREGVLGCRVDGGGRSDSHPDADLVASALAVLPDSLGGRPMAVALAEMARAGRTPDWMPDAQPKVYPEATITNRHGTFAKTTKVGSYKERNRKGVIVEKPSLACPVIIRPTGQQIAKARRAYLDWVGVLMHLRCTFQIGNDLSCYVVTDELPPMQPWKKTS